MRGGGQKVRGRAVRRGGAEVMLQAPEVDHFYGEMVKGKGGGGRGRRSRGMDRQCGKGVERVGTEGR